jgi:cytochrome P450
MFHKLIQRALPGWFPYNSLHATQPMFTRKMNEQIAREIGTIDHYSLADPAPPPRKIVLTDYATNIKVLKDQASFRVPWARYLNDMFPGKTYNDYMLGGDDPANAAQKKLVHSILFSPDQFLDLLSETTTKLGSELLKANTLWLTKDLHQVDIIREYGSSFFSFCIVLVTG